MLSRQIESVASLDSRGCAVALSIFAAVLFGALVGLDRRLAGHKAASAFTIAVGLSGWVIGLAWTAYAPPDWSLDSIWVELSAACCVFALGFGGEDSADFDADEARDALLLRLFQSGAFGIASAVGAFGYSLAFLSFMAAGHLLEWALPACCGSTAARAPRARTPPRSIQPINIQPTRIQHTTWAPRETGSTMRRRPSSRRSMRLLRTRRLRGQAPALQNIAK